MLFYERKCFTYCATVIIKKDSQELADRLLSISDDCPYLFFVENLKKISIRLEDISQLGKYKLGGWRSGLPGFLPLNPVGLKAIEEKFGSIENFIDHYTIPEIKGVTI